MTSFYSLTDSGPESISSYRLYLSLSDLSRNDIEFKTKLKSPFSFLDENISDFQIINSDNSNKLLEYIKNNIDYKSYYNFITLFKLEKYIKEDNITVFIPNSDLSDIIESCKKEDYDPVRIIKANIVKLPILPDQLLGRNFKIRSSLDNYFINTLGYNIDGVEIIDNLSEKNKNKILKSINVNDSIIYNINRFIIPDREF
jgi:hypothetical protein